MIAIHYFILWIIIQYQMIEQVFLSVHDAPLNVIRFSFQCHLKIVISNWSKTTQSYGFNVFWEWIRFLAMNHPKWSHSLECKLLEANEMNRKKLATATAKMTHWRLSGHTIVHPKLKKNDNENQSKFRILWQFKAFLAHYCLFAAVAVAVMVSNFPQHVPQFAL